MWNTIETLTRDQLQKTGERDRSNAQLIDAGAIYILWNNGEALLHVPGRIQGKIARMGEKVYGLVTTESIEAIKIGLWLWISEKWGNKTLSEITTLEIQSFLDRVHKLGWADTRKIERRLPQLREQSGNMIQSFMDYKSIEELIDAAISIIRQWMKELSADAAISMDKGKYLFDKTSDS